MITADSVVAGGVRQYGRFAATPTNANPTAEFAGIRRAFEDWRTKEWVGFTLTHAELFGSMIVQDAKYLGSSEIYVYDRAATRLTQHAANTGGGIHLPSDVLHSHVDFAAKGYAISYDFTDARVVIRIDIAATDAAAAITGQLTLAPHGASHPLVVSSKLPRGGRMYTNKIVFPASGWLQVGDRRYEFDPGRDFAILDEHKSHLPYTTDWTWGTFALPVASGYAGANFAIRPQLDGQEEESCIWTPDAAEPLATVAFDRQGADPLAPWHIHSADGRLDVTFTPEGHKGVDHNFGIIAIHYAQWYGQYDGVLRGASDSWTLDGVHGVCETMHMRA